LASALLALPAAAQSSPIWESDGCALPNVRATYARCGLWFSDDHLMRGAPPSVVAVVDPRLPLPLSRFVRGDSARMFALRYESKSRTARAFQLVGGALMLGESIAILSGGTRTQNADGHTNRTAAAVMISGATLATAAFPVRWLARHDADRALDAHNATLTRE
jgi:hypothetical protein